jgi:hypothetical protein
MNKVAANISRVIRRTHMYTALFLAPWMAMYALSTLIMSRHDFVASLYATKTPEMVTERELDYSRSFPTNVVPAEIGRQILQDLGLDGAHRVSGGKDGNPLVIERQHATTLRRITYDQAKGKLTVQRENFRSNTFLERLHRRHGFQPPYALENSWAFSVDLVAITMLFWSLSGLWLWWELRPTRTIGAVCLGLGVALFAAFLLLI